MSYHALVMFIELWLKSSIGYIGQTHQNRDVRQFEKSAPSNIEHLVEISDIFFMTGSIVQHMETLTPWSILIFQGASVGTSLQFFHMVPERLFQK